MAPVGRLDSHQEGTFVEPSLPVQSLLQAEEDDTTSKHDNTPKNTDAIKTPPKELEEQIATPKMFEEQNSPQVPPAQEEEETTPKNLDVLSDKELDFQSEQLKTTHIKEEKLPEQTDIEDSRLTLTSKDALEEYDRTASVFT